MNNTNNIEGKERNREIILGRNAVLEAIKSGRPIDTLYVQKGQKNSVASMIIAKAKSAGAVIKEVDGRKLDLMCPGVTHQGVAAHAPIKEYSRVSDIFDMAAERGEPPFIVICDEISDPHNLGAIIRTAECAGAHGVIIPKRRSVSLTFSVGKASAGAVEHIHVARVNNIADTIKSLKDKGLWVYAADMGGSPWDKTDFDGPLALIIGSEGKGVGRLIKERSDFCVSIPMKGKINSLNASVAAGILCFEVMRQRSLKG